MTVTHNFKVVLGYTYDCDEEELFEALGVGESTSVPWIKTFADIFGNPTSSYDGYIRDIIVSGDEILIDAYIVEDVVKFSKQREQAGDNWKLILAYFIKMAIMNNAAGIKQLKSVDIMSFKYT